MRERILSQMQWPMVHNGDVPLDRRMMDMVRPFSDAWAAAFWELENLALFNQAAYYNVESRNKHLDEHAAAIKSWTPPNEDDDELYEQFSLALSRERNTIIGGELEVEAIARYADEVTIIACWAFAEKNLNDGLSKPRGLLGLADARSHRWPDIRASFLECGLELETLDSFADADECRRVNNAIKHGGLVDRGLAQIPFFAPSADKNISTLELETQRYYFGVADFIGAMYESSSKILAALPS
ncbi:hypothetical protein [Sphingomonas phyllosphaerae]|uniref:hypothetical protein n=1 Tax=Sphingomonas phyllosphaerae TaxID=257003 RepID=UPI0012DC09F2|nr:hypothetical protein [Sphingomonas phyllosphaerae]